MGADMTYAVCKWPVDEHNKPLPTNEETARLVKERVVACLAGLETPETLEDYGIYVDLDDHEEGENFDWRAHLVEQFGDDIGAIFGGHPRDCSGIDLGAGEYVITGGLSWGDDPTESTACINFVAGLGATDEPFPSAQPALSA